MLRPCRFPYAFPDYRVRLAKQAHSLARFSKRTTELRLPVSPTDGSRRSRLLQDLVSPVARSPPDFKPYCNPRLRVLFSVRSRYLFTIGLGEYLALAVDACRLDEGFPTPATLELPHDVLTFTTGLSPCITLRSRRLREDGRPMKGSPYTTLPVRASVWAVSRSLAVSNDIALRFLFLSILRCFNSRGSPLRGAIVKRFPFGDPWFFASVRLPMAFRSLARPSSASEPSYPPGGTVANVKFGCDSMKLHESSGRLDRTYTRCHQYSRCDPVCTSTLPTHACTE